MSTTLFSFAIANQVATALLYPRGGETYCNWTRPFSFAHFKATSSCRVQLSPGQSQPSAYGSAMEDGGWKMDQSMAEGTYNSCNRCDFCVLEYIKLESEFTA